LRLTAKQDYSDLLEAEGKILGEMQEFLADGGSCEDERWVQLADELKDNDRMRSHAQRKMRASEAV